MTLEVCPRCASPVPVRLEGDGACDQCRSAEAWERYARPGQRLVIGRRAIAAAGPRRAPRQGPGWVPWALASAAVSCGAGAGVLACAAYRARPLAPLRLFVDETLETARWATILGVVAVLSVATALVVHRRRRVFPAWPCLALACAGLLAGGVAAAAGGTRWAMVGGFDWKHVAMPLRGAGLAARWPGEQVIFEATTVILAPGADGDMRDPALGGGAVIRSSAARAWIVTCRHVAVPYAAVGSWFDAKRTRPVLVYFSDGRTAEGRVRWASPPPLDVALVVATVEDPPAPVPLARDASAARRDAEVLFVPNPMRDGWMVHRGRVTRRVMHADPAGTHNLLFTDLPVQPGDSGTGLYDAAGRLIGLNTWAAHGQNARPQGISLPSEVLDGLLRLAEGSDR